MCLRHRQRVLEGWGGPASHTTSSDASPHATIAHKPRSRTPAGGWQNTKPALIASSVRDLSALSYKGTSGGTRWRFLRRWTVAMDGDFWKRVDGDAGRLQALLQADSLAGWMMERHEGEG